MATASLTVISPNVSSILFHLQRRALSADTILSLGFIIANETLNLIPYRQAIIFTRISQGNYKIQTVSGLVTIKEDSPFTVWLQKLSKTFPETDSCQRIKITDINSELVEGWKEWFPEHLLIAPLQGPGDENVGVVLYARELPWQEQDIELLNLLHLTYGYCFWSLTHKQGNMRRKLSHIIRDGFSKWILLCLLGVLFIPVRLTALAPAEVVALNAKVVASPLDGIISTIHVQPNAPVKKGDLLFSLDDTSLKTRYEVAQKALDIARAEALVIEQSAFDNPKSKAELARARGQIKEKEAELAAIKAQLERVTVRADKDGIVIFNDPNDWIRRAVQIGERIMMLADPEDAGLIIWLPVKDALNMEPGAPVRLFLHVSPLSPLNAKLVETSYQAIISPDGISSYKLYAHFCERVKPRIGLRGTARISGKWTVLGYYLFRRPIAAIHKWIGW